VVLVAQPVYVTYQEINLT